MKNTSRREFLKASALASSAVFIPAFLKAFDIGTHYLPDSQGKVLVILQLGGGNDGLNAVIPYRNDLYYSNRPSLGIPSSEVLKMNDELGLNPAMASLKNLYDEGLLSIVNNVGYPDPNRSHFRSMDIWHTASDSQEYLSTGWLGRYLDQNCQECNAYQALELDDSLSLSLKGIERSGFAAGNLPQLKKTTSNPFLNALAHHHGHEHEENVAYLYRTMVSTISSSEYLYEKAAVYKSRESYPLNKLGKALKQVAELIVAGSSTQVYYVSFSGFDTHARQKGIQNNLLKQFSEAIGAFTRDLKNNGKLDDTLLMAFSEFGRRVKENASGGTDHGTANNLYLVGGKLKTPGIYNEGPDLTNLDNGDLIHKVDFRQIYATILKKWLQVDDAGILAKKFQLLDLV